MNAGTPSYDPWTLRQSTTTEGSSGAREEKDHRVSVREIRREISRGETQKQKRMTKNRKIKKERKVISLEQPKAASEHKKTK
jgi:hypothetical protein